MEWESNVKGIYADCDVIKLYVFLGKKWTVPLLHTLSKKPITYNNLAAASKKMINPTLLSSRLKKMIDFNLVITKMVDGKKSYVLTRQGAELKRIMHEIKHWAIENKYYVPIKCKKTCICDNIFGNTY